MAYSSDDDLLKEFSEQELARLTGDPSGATINTDRTDYARANADALIDSYLYGRQDVPFSEPVNPLINKISNDLTVSNLYDFAYRNSSVPGTVTWRKISAIKLLKDIQVGIVSLIGTTPGTNAPGIIISNKDELDKLFPDEILDEFSE
jgi:phage gp36-like protein